MPCVLTRRSDGVFVGKTGRSVEIGVESAAPARLVRMTYAGKDDGEAPFEFKLVRGPQKLLIVAIGSSPGVQHMRILEDPDGTPCFLRNFFWSPTNFFTSLDIEGV